MYIETKYFAILMTLFLGFAIWWGVVNVSDGFGFSLLLPIMVGVYIGIIFGVHFAVGLIAWCLIRIAIKKQLPFWEVIDIIVRFAVINSMLVAISSVVIIISGDMKFDDAMQQIPLLSTLVFVVLHIRKLLSYTANFHSV